MTNGEYIVDRYNAIIKDITEHVISVPELPAKDMIHWLRGYQQAQNEVIEIISRYKKNIIPGKD